MHYVHKTLILKKIWKILLQIEIWVEGIDTGRPVALEVPHRFALPDDAMHSANWAKTNMAAGSSSASSSSNSDTSQQVDRIALLYPKVNESETALPRSWSPKDKFTFIGLSQNNLRVHYKGKVNLVILSSFFSSSANPYHCKLKCQKGLIACFMCYSFALPSQQTRDRGQIWRRFFWRNCINLWFVCVLSSKWKLYFDDDSWVPAKNFTTGKNAAWHLHSLLFEFAVFLPWAFRDKCFYSPWEMINAKLAFQNWVRKFSNFRRGENSQRRGFGPSYTRYSSSLRYLLFWSTNCKQRTRWVSLILSSHNTSKLTLELTLLLKCLCLEIKVELHFMNAWHSILENLHDNTYVFHDRKS